MNLLPLLSRLVVGSYDCPHIYAVDVTDDSDVRYRAYLNEDCTASLWGQNGVEYPSDYTVPSYVIDNYGDRHLVTGIYSFDSTKGMSTISFPDSVIEIMWRAFEKVTIEHVNLPINLQILDYNAFYKCENLKTVTYCGQRSFTNNSFYECSIQHIFVTSSYPHSTLGQLPIKDFLDADCKINQGKYEDYLESFLPEHSSGDIVGFQFLFAIIFVSPNVAFLIYRYVKKLYIAGPMTIASSILINIEYGFLIGMCMDFSYTAPKVLFGINSFLMAFGALLVISICKWDAYVHYDAMNTNQTFKGVFKQNASLPPKIRLKSAAAHNEYRDQVKEYKIEYRTIKSGDKSRVEKKEVLVNTYHGKWSKSKENYERIQGHPWSSSNIIKRDIDIKIVRSGAFEDVITYESWNDISEKQELDSTIVEASFLLRVIKDEDIQYKIDESQDNLVDQAHDRDKCAINQENDYPENFIFKATCINDTKRFDLIKKYYPEDQDWKLKGVYIITFILGYVAIIDSLFGFTFEQKEIELKKVVSGSKQLPGKYDQIIPIKEDDDEDTIKDDEEDTIKDDQKDDSEDTIKDDDTKDVENQDTMEA